MDSNDLEKDIKDNKLPKDSRSFIENSKKDSNGSSIKDSNKDSNRTAIKDSNGSSKREFIKSKGFLRLLAIFAIGIVSIFLILQFVFQRTIVNGSSMYPTLKNNDNLIINKLVYRFKDIKRFDIVVFPYEEANGKTVNYIKRVIGLPGETIEITDGEIYIINDSGRFKLEESYGHYIDDIPMKSYNGSEPVIIGDDEYFVLGDNRNNSIDSRMFGCIKKTDIIGRVDIRLYPTTGIIK